MTYEGKRLDNGEVVYGSLLEFEDMECRIATSCLMDDTIDELLTVVAYRVDPATVRLCDKGGKNGYNR